MGEIIIDDYMQELQETVDDMLYDGERVLEEKINKIISDSYVRMPFRFHLFVGISLIHGVSLPGVIAEDPLLTGSSAGSVIHCG